jgi:hypothetical protein
MFFIFKPSRFANAGDGAQMAVPGHDQITGRLLLKTACEHHYSATRQGLTLRGAEILVRASPA